MVVPAVSNIGTLFAGVDKREMELFERSNETSRVRTRNPPYLVRRGGGIKYRNCSRQQNTTQTFASPTQSDTLLLPKVLEKTFSGEFAGPKSADGDQASTFPNFGEEWNRLNWGDDEDLLFARLIVVRLRRFNAKDRRLVSGFLSFTRRTFAFMYIDFFRFGRELCAI